MEFGVSMLGDKDLELGLGLGSRRQEEEDEDTHGEEEEEAEQSGRSEPKRRRSEWGAVKLSLHPWSSGFEKRASVAVANHGVSSSRRLDVNLALSTDDMETVPPAVAGSPSSPNSANSSFPTDFSATCATGWAKRSETEPERSLALPQQTPGSDDDEHASGRKKLRLSKEQAAFLEESFKEHHTLNPKQKLALAKQLNLRPRQVEVWFQNRRARTKLKQTEVDCEYLKRWCETLTEENLRLQKELADLRALKTASPFFSHVPATTLSMCPSCERVATNGTTTGSAASPSTTGADQRPSSFSALFTAARSLPFAARLPSMSPHLPPPPPASS